jgi:hypothetical protein
MPFPPDQDYLLLGDESGRRIYLDADTSEILIYDADGALVARLSPDGLQVLTPGTSAYAFLRPGGSGGYSAGLNLMPDAANPFNEGSVTATQTVGALRLTSPYRTTWAVPATVTVTPSDSTIARESSVELNAANVSYTDEFGYSGHPYPHGRGLVGVSYNSLSAPTSLITDSYSDTLNVNVDLNRTYEFRLSGTILKPGGSTATRARLSLYVDGALKLNFGSIPIPAAAIAYGFEVSGELRHIQLPRVATLNVAVASDVAGQIVTLFGASSSRRRLVCTDIGSHTGPDTF